MIVSIHSQYSKSKSVNGWNDPTEDRLYKWNGGKSRWQRVKALSERTAEVQVKRSSKEMMPRGLTVSRKEED